MAASQKPTRGAAKAPGAGSFLAALFDQKQPVAA